MSREIDRGRADRDSDAGRDERSTGARPRRTRDKTATQARIMGAAVREFADRGHAEARMPAIADEARVGRRMIHHYHGDMEGLHAAVMRHVRDTVRSLSVLPPALLDPVEGLAETVRDMWRLHMDHPEFLALLEAPDPRNEDHLAVLAGVREDGSPFLARIEQVLWAGAATGAFIADASPSRTYLSILALVTFPISHRRALSALYGRDLGDDGEMRAWADHVVDMVLASVRHDRAGARGIDRGSGWVETRGCIASSLDPPLEIGRGRPWSPPAQAPD